MGGRAGVPGRALALRRSAGRSAHAALRGGWAVLCDGGVGAGVSGEGVATTFAVDLVAAAHSNLADNLHELS